MTDLTGNLPAPTCETPSRLPSGTRVRTPDGHTGIIESDLEGEYTVFSADTGWQWFMTDDEIIEAATEWD